MKKVVIVGAKRTAIGAFGKSLSGISVKGMSVSVFQELLNVTKLDKNMIDEVILGNVLSACLGQNPAKQIAFDIGLKQEISAFCVNQVCGSGLKAIELAYQSIALGNSDIVVAGGSENMSNSVYALNGARFGYKMGNQNLVDTMINDGLWCAIGDYHMGITAENIAKEYKINRQEQDEFAFHSHRKSSLAIKNGFFADEIVPISIKNKKNEVVFDTDEFVRHDIDLESLAKLKPAFDKNGSVTAGNSSGINDGSSLLILASYDKAKELNLPILATLKAFGNIGVKPSIMGIGAAFAAKKALYNAKLNINDIDIIEANEAFASQSIATLKELNLPIDSMKVNIYGGAIALGHPIGASGARILTTLIHALRRNKKTLGLATLCIGGGQGISIVIEVEN